MPVRFRRMLLGLLILAGATGSAMAQEVEIVTRQPIHWDKRVKELVDEDRFVIRFMGQSVEKTVQLPPPPPSPARSPRIIASVRVEPILSRVDGKRRPNDPWCRLGTVTVMAPGVKGAPPVEVELMRFVTPYGGERVFKLDVSELGPLLYGTRTFRVFISSYSDKPGWRVSFKLKYERAGYRRPAMVTPLFNDLHVTGDADGNAVLRSTIDIPAGLAQPRIRLITTGHATDGVGGNEFVTSTHILRVDGRVVARFRPWTELGLSLRPVNRWAGRTIVDGAEIWASDHDRAGWHPGLTVPPTILPLPELTPGQHTIELEIQGIRPRDEDDGHHGYWAVSGVVVADRPLPVSASNSE